MPCSVRDLPGRQSFTGTDDEIAALLGRLGEEAQRTGQVVVVTWPQPETGGRSTVTTALAPPEVAARIGRRTQLRQLEAARRPAPVRRRVWVRRRWARRRVVVTAVVGAASVAASVAISVVVILWLAAHIGAVIGALAVAALAMFALARLFTGGMCPGCLCGTCKGGH